MIRDPVRGVLILRLLSGFRVGYWCWTGVWQKLLVPCSHLPAVFLGTFPWTRRVFFFTCGSSAFGEFGRGAQLFMCGAQFAVSLHYGVLHHGCHSALFKCKKKTTHAHLSFVLVSRGIRLDVLLFLQLLSDAYSHSVP